MALKLTISDLVEVPGTFRSEYKKGDDGKYHLELDGEHPDAARLAKFRDKNIALLKEVDELRQLKVKYEGIDPDVARNAITRAKDAAKFEVDLNAEKAAHASTQLKHEVTTEFLRTGGRASAVDWMAVEAAKVFAIENGKLTTKEFSTTNPDAPLSLSEWMLKQSTVADFAFQPSHGGGAGGGHTSVARFGARSNQKVLKNPTAQQLGEHSAAIAKGDIKIEYS